MVSRWSRCIFRAEEASTQADWCNWNSSCRIQRSVARKRRKSAQLLRESTDILRIN
jgi:hypothetical protein